MSGLRKELFADADHRTLILRRIRNDRGSAPFVVIKETNEGLNVVSAILASCLTAFMLPAIKTCRHQSVSIVPMTVTSPDREGRTITSSPELG